MVVIGRQAKLLDAERDGQQIVIVDEFESTDLLQNLGDHGLAKTAYRGG